MNLDIVVDFYSSIVDLIDQYDLNDAAELAMNFITNE